MVHEIFSIVASVGPQNLQSLHERLRTDDGADKSIPMLRLEQLHMVHFASFVVFPGLPLEEDVARREVPPPGLRSNEGGLTGLTCAVPARTSAPCLVFESCIDGPRDEYLDALVAVGGDTLAGIFCECADFDRNQGRSPEYLRGYLAAHIRRPQLFHIGAPWLRTSHIKAGQALREDIDDEIDRLVRRRRSPDPPLRIVERVRRWANLPPSRAMHWHYHQEKDGNRRFPAWFADPVTRWRTRVWNWSRLLAIALAAFAFVGALIWVAWRWQGALGLAVLALAAGAAWVGVSRWLRHPPASPVVDPAALRQVTELEDFHVQNHMASLVVLKRGLLRRLSIRLILHAFNMVYRTLYTDITPGRLNGLGTIHFAHWTILPLVGEDQQPTGREGLLFLSNYDGSWETYLDDFLARLLTGVVAIWSNAVGFPSPLDGPTFKCWARTCMSPWQSWYQAYPRLTVQQIENHDNARMELLRGPRSDAEARFWLNRFGAVTEASEEANQPPDALPTRDIQGIVLSGYRHLPHATYLLLRIDDGAAARRWLHDLLPLVTDAAPMRKEELAHQQLAINVAFTASGFDQLGLDRRLLESFPLVFREGIAPAHLHHRSRALGDVGTSRPHCWQWGAPGSRVDIALLVYAADPVKLDSMIRQQLGRFETSGAGGRVTDIQAGFLARDPKRGPGTMTEHFGFADGISQPEIEGAWRASRRVHAESSSVHLVKPGEFLLGHPAGDGTRSPGVPIPGALDPEEVLPDSEDVDGARDFGRNGSYLVIRQLAQKVAALRSFAAAASGAGSLAGPPAAALAGRLVGRMQDGVPLGSDSPSNEFGFSTDRQGFGCPIGSHIRRANPRDSLTRVSAAALRSANRHRLLRRGRPYGPVLPPTAVEDDGHERGMVFICLNSDIERQFEFVQQNWINNPSFGGLYDERDPLLGEERADGRGSFTVQASPVRCRVAGLTRFVDVKGGGYFFLPGLSALHYIASLRGDPLARAAVNLPSFSFPAQAIAGGRPSRLARALKVVESVLPWLRLAWAARFPLALMLALALLPLAARRALAIASTFFLVTWWGLALVGLVASLAAFVGMITLRLVLLYGWRSDAGRARWTGSASWLQVLAFQALALPIVLACIEWTAADLAEAHGGSYWRIVLTLAPAAVLGGAAALAVLAVATAVQAFRPGTRPELFFPPNPVLNAIVAGGWRPRPVWAVSRAFSLVSTWLVDSVPQEIGLGYIDYRTRRLLPGHAFALVLAALTVVLYVAGYIGLNPAWSAAAEAVPPIAYVVFLLILAAWLLSAAAFLLDRYRLPTLLAVGAWLIAVASVARTDHYFQTGAPIEPGITPAAAVIKARRQTSKVVVVAAEGLGLVSSAWTAEVLTQLTSALGAPFADSLRLVSASSGAALGTVYYAGEYTRTGHRAARAGSPVDEAVLAAIRERARRPASGHIAWGLAYPDFVRAFAPILVPTRADRGWAMEQAWVGTMPDGSVPTLSQWRIDVREGWRPASAFGVTIVETGKRGLLATYASPGDVADATDGRDVSMITAARLAATFPFVTPVARPDTDLAAAYHVADGGYWDNSGVVAAIEWLNAVDGPGLNAAEPRLKDDVLLIEIRSSSSRTEPAPEARAWTFDLIGPLRAMIEARYDSQPVRNQMALTDFTHAWNQKHDRKLSHAIFSLGDERARLSWNLGAADLHRVSSAWKSRANQEQLTGVRAFMSKP